MIYITGDTHMELYSVWERICKNEIKEGSTIIVAGDFGFVWDTSREMLAQLKDLSHLNYTFCFVDGNHEGFDFLYSFPVEEWNGEKIHRVCENIIHLMRGQVFTIENKKYYTFGGAYSTDKLYRRPKISWWEQEIPTKEEYNEGAENLKQAGYKVDYVITHTIPDRFVYQLGFAPNDSDRELTSYFDWLYDNLQFSKWFSGHWHVNRFFDDGKMNILYEKVVTIQDND